MPTDRERAVEAVATLVLDVPLPHPTRLAVDGITAAGKSTLAGELAGAIRRSGRSAIHLSMDGFHHRRDHRYRKGRMSAIGYYEDAYDFAALAALVLEPLGPGGDRRYRERVIDLATDEPVSGPSRLAAADAVLIIDGSFLQRPEVRASWDVRVFVDTSVPVTLERGVARDADTMGGPRRARRAYERRYQAAGRLYLDGVRPRDRADIVVENDDPAHPVLHVARAFRDAVR